ncbi:hypothetical protein CPB86DRAFT_828461 [Serendipita vermifera]|nr:hypothetical protein CPB86DRAFT_828461 [Serendipita vermifera]
MSGNERRRDGAFDFDHHHHHTAHLINMNQIVTERLPIEIWENIFSYATASSLLPFTENGELASSLIDTMDLFPESCDVFKKYRDDTQVTVECLRLVCRSWACILQRMANEFTYTDLRTSGPEVRPIAVLPEIHTRALAEIHLGGLKGKITNTNPVILSEEVLATSLLWLSLATDTPLLFLHYPRFMPWVFPRLRTFRITGRITSKYEPGLETFLSRHARTLIELDIDTLKCYRQSFTSTSVMSLSLWNICPNVETLRLGKKMTAELIEKYAHSGQKVPDVAIPRLTLIVDPAYGMSEAFLETCTLLNKFINLKKVIHSKSWQEVKIRDNSVGLKSGEGLKRRAEDLLEKFERLGILIVDRFQEPLLKFLHRIVERPELFSFVN